MGGGDPLDHAVILRNCSGRPYRVLSIMVDDNGAIPSGPAPTASASTDNPVPIVSDLAKFASSTTAEDARHKMYRGA